MIVKMKKVYCICQAKDSLDTLTQLRKLGVVHVEHQRAPQGKDIALLQEDINLALSAEAVLTSYCSSIEKVPQIQSPDWKVAAHHIIDLEKRLDQLKEYECLIKNRIIEWEAWGDFEPQKIEELAHRKIFLRFYQIPLKEIKSLPEGSIVKNISVSGGIANCVIIDRDKKDMPYKEIIPPKDSLNTMRRKVEEDGKVEKTLEKDLIKHADHYSQIQQQRALLEKELKFQQALKGMGQSGEFAYLAGYVPEENSEMLLKSAAAQKWAVSVSDTSEEDNVPVLLRNPAWVALISPVFKFLEILPGYKELDVSLPFLIFFSIFFGILIGDAGYGLVYFLITLFIQKKSGKNKQTAGIFLLFYILSSCAIAWGLMTGTFFGQEWFLKTGYQPLVPALNDEKNIQRFCFFLGAFHLSIAHTWRTIIKLPSLSALAEVGWLGVLWTAFLLARVLILGDSFPVFGKWMLISGITLVILFTNPQKNMLKAIGEGLGTLALSLMNSFTDVVSYIRLFAVGLAGVSIADAFNSMAGLPGMGNVFAVAMSVFIVLIGHALGLVLGPVSVLVHGVRLNVLEFSGHASVSWSGTGYDPLKE